MPQFDTITFFNQVFWLVLIFLNSYIIILRFLLIPVGLSLKSRNKSLKRSIRL